MSNKVNDQIIEGIYEEVNELSINQVVNEVLNRSGDQASVAPSADSWDEFWAQNEWSADRWRIELAVQRFEELCR
tara:strand:+ start:4061 stop:4285 length:225 start_codon:yes stop_codon:yes gene_type:complete